MTDASVLRTTVLIVGAGPVGLMLANLLGVQGIDTLVIERHASTVREPRAVTLDDESLRTLQAAGLAEAVVEDLVLGYGVQYFSWRGKPLASIQPTRQEYGYPKRNAFRQPLLERALLDGTSRFPNVRVCFEHELLALAQRDDGVECSVHAPAGPLRVDARWVVGCDGGRSHVRTSCGIALRGDTHDERWLIVDLADRTTPLRHTQTFCDPLRPAIRLPGPHATLRYEFMLRPGEDNAFALHEPRFRAWMAQRCAEDRDLPLVRKAVYVFHARVAERWRQGRVFLAGDAAHLTPPFAGQGLNSGLRDAANLAWKLAAVARGELPDALLDSYETERRPHAQALIGMALRIGAFMQPRTRLGAASMQGLLKVACLLPAVRDYILQLRFKPPARLASGASMLPQPDMELPDRSMRRLDDLLGGGFAVIGFGTCESLARIARTVPQARVRCVALLRANEDFLGDTGGGEPDGACVHARDGSGALEGFLDRLGAAALVVRPDRYWSRAIPAAELARSNERAPSRSSDSIHDPA